MKEKELRRLSRTELLELLLAESRRSAALEEELRQAREQLASREIRKERAGSLAEAALSVNGVLEAADAAAKQYLENIRRQVDEEGQRLLQETRQYCRDLRRRAEGESADGETP